MKISVRFMLRRQLAEELDDLRLDGHVERGHAFVGDDQLRIDRQRAGDAGALALAAAHAARLAVGEFALEADQVEQFADARRDLRRWRPCPAPAAPRPASAPIVSRGLSALKGSWKTIAVSRRSVASAGLVCGARSTPSKVMWPDESGVRPRTARASVLLPLPDSPTMPTRLARHDRRLTPLTALTACTAAGTGRRRSEAHMRARRFRAAARARRRLALLRRFGGASLLRHRRVAGDQR